MSVTQLVSAMNNCIAFNKHLVLKHINQDRVAIVKSMTFNNGSFTFVVERDGLDMDMTSYAISLMLDNYVIYDLKAA